MKNRILVIEDEASISELICMNLGIGGYEARPLYTGREVLELLEEEGGQAGDLALVDVMLPDRDGKGEKVLSFRNMTVDLTRHSVRENGREVALKPMEFALLTVFLKNRNRILSRDRLLDMVWGTDFQGETRTVDVHVANLRKKLAACGAIRTIPKAGYLFEDDDVCGCDGK